MKKAQVQASKQGKNKKKRAKSPDTDKQAEQKQGSSATEINIEHQNRELASRTGGMVYESKNVLYG